MSDSLLLKKSGILAKKGAVRHSWRKRFFGLTQEDLKYWTSSDQKVLKGSIDLRLGGEVRKSETAELTFLIKPHGDYRTWQLRASTQQELDSWIRSIDQVIDENKEQQMVRSAVAVREASPPVAVKVRHGLSSLSKKFRRRDLANADLDELDRLLREDNPMNFALMVTEKFADEYETRVPIFEDRSLPHTTTLLHWAAHRGAFRCAHVLIQQGADINAQQASDGCAPLHIACDRINHVIPESETWELMVATLLACGADPHIKDANDKEADRRDLFANNIFEALENMPHCLKVNAFSAVGDRQRLKEALEALAEEQAQEAILWRNWRGHSSLDLVTEYSHSDCHELLKNPALMRAVANTTHTAYMDPSATAAAPPPGTDGQEAAAAPPDDIVYDDEEF